MEEKILCAWGLVLDIKSLENNITEYTVLSTSGILVGVTIFKAIGKPKAEKGGIIYFEPQKNANNSVAVAETLREVAFEVIKELLVKDSKGIVEPNVDTDIRDFCMAVTMGDISLAHKCLINWDSQTVNYLKNMFFSDYNHSQANTR